jgi:hypothetical protein
VVNPLKFLEDLGEEFGLSILPENRQGVDRLLSRHLKAQVPSGG